MFSKIYNKENIKLRDAIVTRWSKDEFSLGSYSFSQIGSSKKDVKILGKPIDERIWLMGEHVSDLWKGTVHGAWHSGMESARKAIK